MGCNLINFVIKIVLFSIVQIILLKYTSLLSKSSLELGPYSRQKVANSKRPRSIGYLTH